MAATGGTARGRLLVVDDDDALRGMMRELLEGAGYDVTVAADGTKALEVLKNGAFDAILSDVVMPDLGGLELLRSVRERDLDIPVVLLTGNPDVESAARSVNYGAFRYLIKPVESAELIGVAGEATRLSRLARLKRKALEHLGPHSERLLGDRAGLEASFERALGTLWVAFQPIFDIRGALWGSEALMRTSTPPLTEPLPMLQAAERLGRHVELGRVVRDHVAAIFDLRSLPGPVCVNVHPLELEDDELYRPLSPLGRRAREVILELTEQTPLTAVADVRARVRRLKELGFRIAIDDLGAGYAGLNSFIALEPDVVKLDLSLVRSIDREPRKRRLVRSLIELCHESDILVVGEGVETEAEQQVLIEAGCDLMQGFGLARPARIGS
jgi:EAL domain-containing protein (putative c-di-GMP-specific phosphodiesterase class I)